MRTEKVLLDELERLYAELDEVEASSEEYLPEYGHERKDDVISLLKEEIADAERELASCTYDYTEEELEDERMQLCLSQGLSRWC